jgi:hypothetical protein
MELVLNRPDEAPILRTEDLVVIVVCEDGTTALRACGLLRRVGRNSGVNGRLIYSWWTFGVLASPWLQHLAAQEAAAADLIVVATRRTPKLPETVKDWLGLWLAKRQDQPRRRALVALLESNSKRNPAARGVLSDLRNLVESADVDFFAKGEDLVWDTAPRGGVAPPSGNPRYRVRRRGARVAGRSGKVPVATGAAGP